MARSSRRSAVLVLVIVIACGCAGMLFGQHLTSAAIPSDGDIRDNLREFTSVYEVVQQNYAEPVSPDKAIYNGRSRDAARPDRTRISSIPSPTPPCEEQRGKYYGVGMQVGPRNNKVIVIAPFTGAPAYRAAFGRVMSSSRSTASPRTT